MDNPTVSLARGSGLLAELQEAGDSLTVLLPTHGIEIYVTTLSNKKRQVGGENNHLYFCLFLVENGLCHFSAVANFSEILWVR